MRLRSVTLFVLLLLLTISPAHAEKRVALVIGNAAYKNVAALQNPRNDADDIAASLTRLNFSVSKLIDGTFDDMRRALLQFGREAVGADMAVIYYSGHGMEIGGENWLIPVDAELQSDRDAENEAIALKSAMYQVANGSTLGLVILDACRNNPFAAKMQRSARYRAVDRGLVRIEPSDNVLVAYAAREGTIAGDGDGRHSPFTTALLNNIETPGLEINFLFRNVRDEVLAATKREQQPFVYGSLSKQAIYLKEPLGKGHDAATSNQPVQTEAERAWALTQGTTSQAVLEEFIKRYGDSFYGTLARARLEELKKGQVAVVAPPPSALGDPQNTILLDTKYGRVVIKLRTDIAPKHAERIKLLTREKFYDNVPFHRVIAGFMAQTGDGQRGDGTGVSKYPNLPAEFSNVPFKRGTVGMARKGGDNNSANSQFFIMYTDGSSLNGQYTVIGEVVSGMDAVDKIKKGEPVIDPDRIIRMQVAADAR